MDSLDHIQKRILWIHDLNVSLLWIQKEWILPGVTRNNFNTYTAPVWQHCSSLWSYLNSRHGLNDRYYQFSRNSKIAIQTEPALFKFTRKNLDKTATQLCRDILQHFTFPVDILFQDSSSSSIQLTVQNTMKDQQICDIIISCVILSEGYHQYCGLFLSEMSEK